MWNTIRRQCNLMNYTPIRGGGFNEKPVNYVPTLYNPVVLLSSCVQGWWGLKCSHS
jgi:hypothetical protein